MAEYGPAPKIHDAQDVILAAIRRGTTYESAAQFAGVSYRTMRRWLKRGEEELERVGETKRRKVRKREAAYVAFYQKFQQAKAQGELTLADVILTAAQGGDVIRETSIVEIIRDGNVVEKRTTKTEKTKHQDWRAAAFMLERRHDWTNRQENLDIEIDLKDLDADELKRVANGDDPIQVILDRFRKS